MCPRKASGSYDVSTEKISYLSVFSVCVIHILLSPIFQCYGVFLTELVLDESYSLEVGVWTVVIFTAISKITYPWAVTYCRSRNSSNKLRRNVIIFTIFLCLNLFLVSWASSPICQILLYGGLGGLITTTITVHLKFLFENKNEPDIFQLSENICKPLSVLLSFTLTYILSETYGVFDAQFIFSAIILNVIPACLLIRVEEDGDEIKPLSKFETIDKLSIEMIEVRHKSASDDESSEEEEDPEEIQAEPVQLFQNSGVKILPQIPEEDETEDEDDINEISSKRLSRISARLQELNETHKDITLSINNLYRPEENEEIKEVEEVVEDIYRRNRYSRMRSRIDNYFYFKRKRVSRFFDEHFIRGFRRAFGGKYYIYPSMLTCSITSIISTVFIPTIPSIALIMAEENQKKIENLDADLLIIIIAFGWLLFVAIYLAGLRHISRVKTRLLFFAGLTICGSAVFLSNYKYTNDNLTLSCILFGIGHGIVSLTENLVLEDFYDRRWRKGEAHLEITTGFIVIFIYLVIYFCDLQIYVLLTYACWVYLFAVVVWIVAFVSKLLYFRIRNTRRYRRQQFNLYYSNVLS